MKNLGIVLIVLGLILTIYTGFSYFQKEKVVDLGKVEITADKKKNVVWSPIVGIVIMGIGGIILWTSNKNK